MEHGGEVEESAAASPSGAFSSFAAASWWRNFSTIGFSYSDTAGTSLRNGGIEAEK